MKHHHAVVIVGGGTAGITVAARLKKKDRNLDVAIAEPSEDHFYQPLWTMVGGGVFKKEVTRRDMADYIPKGVVWIKDYVSSFSPDSNHIVMASGREIGYEYLIVAPGIQLNWGAIPGLKESLGKGGVCSNYGYEKSEYTWETLRNLKKGTALFTQPATLIKCGAAPQKIMYLTADHLRRNHLLDDVDIEFMSPGTTIFGVEEVRLTLLKVIDRYGITLNLKTELIEIKGDEKRAVFKVTEKDGSQHKKTVPYDMLHVVPPQSAPDFVRDSELVNEEGWVDVDPGTLQHNRYRNIFSLGDVSSTPNAKSGAAIRKQAPIVVSNLMDMMKYDRIVGTKRYNGYSSCPLVTGYGKLILAEFDYDNKPDPSFPFDTSNERWSMYMMKIKLLPVLYWHFMLKGRA